jgi:hypothetical protein
MLTPHTAELCILCLKEPPFLDGFGFSEEHVIPEALGGILTCKFLCKSCNDSFGKGFEARAKTDPSIRLAIGNLRDKLPNLYNSIEQNQPHLLRTEVGVMPGKFNKGKIHGKVVKMPDKSLMVPEELTHKKLRELLLKDGLGTDDIDEALKRFDDAPEERETEIAPGTSVIKRIVTVVGPDLSNGKFLDPLVSLKITYEFAALSFGQPLFANNPALNEIRRTLYKQDSNSKIFTVEPLMAEEYAPFHGIAFEGNDPHAKFQIRLFGRLAYRIRLPNLSFNHKPFAYTHDLVKGTERLDFTGSHSNG